MITLPPALLVLGGGGVGDGGASGSAHSIADSIPVFQLPRGEGPPFPKAVGYSFDLLGIQGFLYKEQTLMGLVYFVLELTKDTCKDKEA